MANKVFDFLSSFLSGQGGGTGKGPSAADLERIQKSLESQIETLNKLADAYASQEQTVKNLTRRIENLKKANKDYSKEQEDLLDAQEKLEISLRKLNIANIDFDKNLGSHAKKLGITNKELEVAIEKQEGLGEATKETSNHFSGLAGKLGITSESIKKITNIFTLMEVAVIAAGEQIVELNEKLIKFQRATGGTLTARNVGFDIYGNGATGRAGSIKTLTSANNLSVDEFLTTFKAFSGGQIIGLTDNLQNSQVALQDYGIAIGRITKLYGVSGDTIASLSQSLSQNFGVSIKDITTTLQHGADVAEAAGLNVGKMFDNMAKIAGLQGSLFVEGGAQGIEKTAFALTKLGLSVNSLQQVNDSVKSFSDVFEKQNRAAALGLSLYSTNVGRIFAKTQLGRSGSALTLQQVSLAQDVNRVYGGFNNQSLQALQSVGLQQEQIQGVKRLIQEQKLLGRSFADITDETKLSTVELAKKRKIEQEDTTFIEKGKILLQKLESVILDPIASVLGPLADIVFNGLSVAFSVLQVALKPVTFLFQILGNGLTKIADVFRVVTVSVENFLKSIGMDSGKSADTFNKMVDILGTVAAILLGIRAIEIARFIWEKGQAVVNGIGNLLGGSGVLGKIGKLLPAGGAAAGLGKLALKGSAIGAGIGLAGNLVGNAVGGRAGNTISTASDYAGVGALIGTIVPVIGTAVGAGVGALAGVIVSNWDVIKGPVLSITKGIWKIVSTMLFLPLLWKGIKSILEWLHLWHDEDKQKDDSVKIANTTSGIASTTSRVAAVMKTRQVFDTDTIKRQEQQMNQTFAPNVIIKSDLFGGYKVKAAGM